jgi:hypothetical protein
MYTSVTYMRGAAVIGLGTTIKYLRCTTSGAAGNGDQSRKTRFFCVFPLRWNTDRFYVFPVAARGH